jgi:hypothetical protein
LATNEPESDSGASGPPPPPAAAVERRGVLSSPGAKITGILTAAATATVALGTLTDFGERTTIRARQFFSPPNVSAALDCGQSVLRLTVKNRGWSSVVVTRPEVIWREKGKDGPAAVYDANDASAPGKGLAFPVRLDPGQELDAQLKNDSDGFYFPIEPGTPVAADQCQMSANLSVEYSLNPRNSTPKLATCICV